MASSKKAAIGFIFLTLLIDVTGLGLIIPVFPKLIESMTHGNISDVSQWGGWLTFSYAIMQFLCAPVIGGLSDKYGRRPVLLLSLFGFGIDYLFLSFAPTIPTSARIATTTSQFFFSPIVRMLNFLAKSLPLFSIYSPCVIIFSFVAKPKCIARLHVMNCLLC